MAKNSTQSSSFHYPSLIAKPTSAISSGDTEVVAVFQESAKDGVKKAISPEGSWSKIIERFRKNEAFVASVKTMQFGRFLGADDRNLLFVGFGVSKDCTEELARQNGGVVWQKLCAERAHEVVIHADLLAEHPRNLLRAFAEGMLLACYRFTKYKSLKQKNQKPTYLGPSKLIFVTRDKKLQAELEGVFKVLLTTVECVHLARDWSNEPSNFGTPEYFAKEAQRWSKKHGLKCKVLNERDAQREGMDLFLGVGYGSERESKIVVVEYSPKKSAGKKPKTVVFVGKGITFDSGGISIKPSGRMEEMKHDMSGASTVFSAALLAARLGVENRVVAIMGFAENMPSGDAIQPGNIIEARSGKTVEILNTDAEGRLILADLLDYAHDFEPDVIVNAATLTGACGVALGRHCCALMGNDEALTENLKKLGNENGERMWELPLFDEYLEEMKSDTADLRNISNDSMAGTIRGGIFLKQFIKAGTKWAHLDIAYTATDLGFLPYHPKKGATGAYVRTLAQFAAEF